MSSRAVRRTYFITRKFPPSVGGMETLAAGVWRTLSAADPDAVLIAHGGSNRQLVRWLPVTLLRVLWLALGGRMSFVLVGDAVLYTALAPILRLARVPHATMVMGLDLTYENRVYRAVVHPVLRRAPQVVAISEATAAAATGFDIPAARIQVVRLGVSAPEVSSEERLDARRKLGSLLDVGKDGVLLLTLGRLVRRKGARWFVDEVMTGLPTTTHYVVAGDGPEAAAIRGAVDRQDLAARVHLLGRVDDETRELLMRGADVFVQPNIQVAGDMEGFGLVTVEAALRGTPVVAADLEGIKDAVQDGTTGILLPSGESTIWASRLTDLVRDPSTLVALGNQFARAARGRYSEQVMGEQLLQVLGLDAAGGRLTEPQL